MNTREEFEKLGGLITTTRYELTHFLSASNYSEGTIIDVDKKYSIEIIYGEYKTPALKSVVKDFKTGKAIGCTPGVTQPYYINEFLHR